MSEPRPYQLVVYYYINGERCEICAPFQDELSIASYSYSIAKQNEVDESGDKLPIFFVSFEFRQDRKPAFLKCGVNGVPFIGISNPERAMENNSEYDQGEKWQLQPDENIEA